MRLSLSSIKHAQRKFRWRKSGPRYCQIVREANRVKRLAFATKCRDDNKQFKDVIFTDESSIWVSRHSKLCFRKVGEPGKMKPTAKHPFKVHVWVEELWTNSFMSKKFCETPSYPSSPKHSQTTTTDFNRIMIPSIRVSVILL